ncbi:MAG: hypothetical protein ABI378_14295 [Chitinophagaceae bacterium]
MSPYYGGNNLTSRVSPLNKLEVKEKLWCHPCSKLGYGRCPHGHFKCLKGLDMEKIAADVKKLWTSTQPK